MSTYEISSELRVTLTSRRGFPYSHFTWAWHAVIMGTGITSALIINFPYGGGSAPVQWLGFGLFILNFILFVFVCGCTIARYVMFPEARTRHTKQVSRLILFISGLGTDVTPPGSKSIYRVFSDGCYNVD